MTSSMKTLKHVMAILAVIGASACDGGSIDNSYDDNYFEEETGGKESWEIDYEEEIALSVLGLDHGAVCFPHSLLKR